MKEACQGVDMAFLAGSAPHRPGMDRFDLLAANVPIFQRQARALAQFASPDIRVVVIANPANTLAWLLSACAPEIPKERISALTRLDHNRAVMHLARRFHCAPQDVVGVAVWGNHSSTMVPDVSRAFAAGVDVWEAGGEELADEVVETVRRRGFEVLRLRGAPAGMSTARAACDQMRDWVMGTDPGRHVSMAVCSDGSYGMPPGLWYGFPVECQVGLALLWTSFECQVGHLRSWVCPAMHIACVFPRVLRCWSAAAT